jgi:hypothetical protein
VGERAEFISRALATVEPFVTSSQVPTIGSR